MRKIICLLLTAALMLTIFAGCDRPAPTPTETQAPTEPTDPPEEWVALPGDARPYLGLTLTFGSLLSQEDPRAGVIDQAVEMFRARTGAEVAVRWYGGDESALLADLAQTDIFNLSLDALDHQVGSLALDLEELAAAAGYGDYSYPVLADQIRERCGYLAGIAQEPLVYGMYYNAAAFSDAGVTEAPESWEDFLALSQTLVHSGYMPLTIDMETAHLILELHLRRHLGYDAVLTRMQEGSWNRDPADVELFRLCIAYAEAGFLAEGDPAAFPGGQNKLALSNVAMVAGSNDLCGQVERSTLMDVHWGVFPYPGEGAGTGFAVDSRVLGIRSGCGNAQAAFDFIMLLCAGEFDQLYADAGEGIPADPANESGIAGACELLAVADTRAMGILSDRNMELFTRLWNGWYKTPSYFGIALNGLKGEYAQGSVG